MPFETYAKSHNRIFAMPNSKDEKISSPQDLQEVHDPDLVLSEEGKDDWAAILTERWTNELLGEVELTKKMREGCATIIRQYFKGAREYEIEKFIKAFAEPIYARYHRLREEKNLTKEDLQKAAQDETPKEELFERQKELRHEMQLHIRRQCRHFLTFLPAVNSVHS